MTGPVPNKTGLVKNFYLGEKSTHIYSKICTNWNS